MRKCTPALFLAIAASLLPVAGVQAQAVASGSPQAAASAPGPGAAPGGRGMGPARGGRVHGLWGRNYTPGWSMMSPQERDEHRRRMEQARSAEECRGIRDEHRKLMEERARERGRGAMRGPRHDACGGWGPGR